MQYTTRQVVPQELPLSTEVSGQVANQKLPGYYNHKKERLTYKLADFLARIWLSLSSL